MKELVILTLISMVVIACQNSTLGEGGVAADGGGFNSSALVGGREAKSSDQVAKAVVGVVSEAGEDIYTCTGFLIRQDLVMTSAHCVVPSHKNVTVYFSRSLGETPNSRQSQVAPSHVRIHEQFQTKDAQLKSYNPYDIAILKLDTDAPSDYEPLSLIERDFDYEALARAQKNSKYESETLAKISGFGVTSYNAESKKSSQDDGILRVGNVALADPDKATSRVGILDLDHSREAGFCLGDSGGPVMIQRDGEWFAIGVYEATIPGSSDNACRGSGIAVKIGYMGDWIMETSADLR